jgi:hypothetical protein
VAASAAALALVGCGTHAAVSASSRVSAADLAGPRPAWIESVQMISASDGWAVLWTSNPGLDTPAALEPARTTDGGRTWVVVTPSAGRAALARGGLLTMQAVSADRAWLAITGVSMKATPHRGQTEVFLTGDGGRSWRQSAPLPVADAELVDFIDRSDGWLLDSLGAAMQVNPVRLYRSTDGGMHWSLVAATASSALAPPGKSGLPVGCDKGGLSFASPRVGFITGGCNELAVWVSRDGGRRWSLQRLPLPASTCAGYGCSIPAPQFIGRTGFLTIDDDQTLAALLLASGDVGVRWHAVRLPAGAGRAQVRFFSAASGIAVPVLGELGAIGRVFYVTADGGKRWTAVPQGRRFGEIASVSFDFVSAATGFAWRSAGNSPGGPPPMYETTDSGRTWLPFTPRLG